MFKNLLIDAVIEQIKRDILDGELLALENLLDKLNVKQLGSFLPEEKLNQLLGKEQGIMYEPQFLSWCKSYDQEVTEMRELIAQNPADVKMLKKEYEELTGKKYRG